MEYYTGDKNLVKDEQRCPPRSCAHARTSNAILSEALGFGFHSTSFNSLLVSMIQRPWCNRSKIHFRQLLASFIA